LAQARPRPQRLVLGSAWTGRTAGIGGGAAMDMAAILSFGGRWLGVHQYVGIRADAISGAGDGAYWRWAIRALASPSRMAKPHRSVAVVRMGPLASAGSALNRLRASGTVPPMHTENSVLTASEMAST